MGAGEAIEFCDMMYGLQHDSNVRVLGNLEDLPPYRGVIRFPGVIQLRLRFQHSSLQAVAVMLIQGDGPIVYSSLD